MTRIWKRDEMEREKKVLFLTSFSVDLILDMSERSVEIHFQCASI